MAAMTVSAQKRYYEFADDTIKADTNYYPSTAGFKVESAYGVLSFEFTHADVADSLSFVRFEGKIGTEWVPLTGTAAMANTSTDGTDQIYNILEFQYLYYRVALACASGDTVAVTDPVLMYKD